jgi:hypothetical protein
MSIRWGGGRLLALWSGSNSLMGVDVGSVFSMSCISLTVKPTTTTQNLHLFKTRATCPSMTNFPYDIQMTAMFIFITLYLVMDIIF